jgi:chromodomain-helicase-DNA-binding protein 4
MYAEKYLILVAEREKADGLLAPFDPSNAFIHLDSRIRNTIRVDMSKLPRKSDKRDSDEDAEFSSLTDLPYTSEDVASDDPYSSYESDGNEVVLRRSNRAATRKKSVMKLPYSPKKTRSTMRRSASTPYGSDDELGGYKQDSPSKGVSAPTRSSNRTRKTIAAITVDSSAYEDSGQEDDDGAGSDFQVGRKPKIAKKKVTPKASRPAYGQIRPITDLDYDDDEETAALRAHRDDCEKCHQKPAHILLARFRKRPKQKGKPRRNSDDEDEEDDEEEKLVNKGGWVRW